MFTGIVEEVGKVRQIKMGAQSALLTVEAHKIMDTLKIGDSVCTNGVCLTVITMTDDSYTVDVMHETLRRTNLGQLKTGSKVNLERAMPANGRFDGHIVAGHSDGTGKILSMERDDISIWIKIEAGPEILKYVVSKGSIAIDGISLTVAEVDDSTFSVSVIPHTMANTILLDKKPGDLVNLETDMIGKYVEKLLSWTQKEDKKPESKITMEFLAENGF
ncbi:MAG: riboflavin synthase [Lachnospiraceae bacterium]|nr:riboflavin synthase [Lachnospiraceae bacterium]